MTRLACDELRLPDARNRQPTAGVEADHETSERLGRRRGR
jgi:hypothetical protein